jgi:uncharacterized protein YndB with AHSA1/START domain
LRFGGIVIVDSITQDILISASPDVVYDVVSKPEHISQWFSDEAEVEAVPDGRGRLAWRDDDGKQAATVEITVVTADRPHLFAFSWVAPDRERAAAVETTPILVEFRISAETGGTRLVVCESGLDRVAWDEDARDAYATDHTDGWAGFLPKLRTYAESLVPQGSA